MLDSRLLSKANLTYVGIMKDELAVKCKLYVQNRDILKSEFKWASSNMLPLCAYMYTEREKRVDAVRIEKCRQTIMKQIGVFSKVKGQEIFPLAILLSLETNEEKAFVKRKEIYKLLKEEFETTSYLPLLAFSMAEYSNAVDYANIIKRAKRLEESIQNKFQGSELSKCSGISILLALSDKTEEKMLKDLEMTHELFKDFEFDEGIMPLLCFMVAVGQAEAVDACEKIMSAYSILAKNRIKLKKIGEMTALGLVATSKQKTEEYIKNSMEINKYLSLQKGFDLLNISSAERHMYSFMLAEESNEQILQKQIALVAALYSTILVSVMD